MASEILQKRTNSFEDKTFVTQSPERVRKSPLASTWTLWFFKQDNSALNWEDNQHVVLTFDTVEDFWALYNHINYASMLRTGCDYSLFRNTIRPAWEDSRNKNGGRWLINLQRMGAEHIDTFWMELNFLMIGESFEDDSDEVCGAVINIRGKGNKLSLWTANCKNERSVLRIGRLMKKEMKLDGIRLQYQSHMDLSRKMLNPMYDL